MTAVQLPYALCSLAKVNALLGFTTGADATRDQVISDLIASITDYIEGYCGGRRFLSTVYTEIYDAYRSNKIFLRQRPVSAVSSVAYRGGMPSAPTWIVYNVNAYIVYLAAGFINFFATFSPFPQAFQVSYTAGYLIDWANFNDPTKHTLPRDLTQVAAELAAQKYNWRLSQGIYQESTEGQSITYESDRYSLNDDHKNVLKKYMTNRFQP